jgi:hypothetical protein
MFFEVASICWVWAMEGCGPIHGKIATTKSMPEEHHSRLSRTWPWNGATISEQISQRVNMLRRFRRGNKPMQKDGHHLPMVNQHAIFTHLFKIMEIQIPSFVLPFVWRCVPEPYYFLHRVKDVMPFLLLSAPSQGCYALPITFCTELGTLCPSLRKCRIIQALSSRPQCLVECNLVFLRGTHEIWWNGMWSRVSVESKTQLLTQPLRSRQDYKGVNQSEGSSTVTMQSDSPSNAWSASRSFVPKGRGFSHNARALGYENWP